MPARVLNRALLAQRISEMWGGDRMKNLAEILGVSAIAVSKWVSQSSAPHSDQLDKLRLYLGFPTIDDMYHNPSGDGVN